MSMIIVPAECWECETETEVEVESTYSGYDKTFHWRGAYSCPTCGTKQDVEGWDYV